MLSPYGLDIIESCFTCKLRADRLFCDLPTSALQSFESIKYATAYPKGLRCYSWKDSLRAEFMFSAKAE